MIDAREEIESLVGFEGRGPGTDAERRGALHLRGRLEALGRDAEMEPIWIRPNWPLAHTAYALFGVVASIVAIAAPAAAAIVAGIALAALIGDLSGRIHTGRLLTGRRGSQNVVSREDGDRPGTLVLVAHYDTGRTGFVYGHATRLGRRVGPFAPLALALLLVLATAILRAAGQDTLPVEIVQFAATVFLIFCVAAFADVALSGTAPGANDNASGVATVLRLAERYSGDLDHFEVWVLLTGGEDALAEGMREWMRRHRRDLDPTRTVFLNVEAVGGGAVRYSRREGTLTGASVHPQLVALCDQIAREDADEGRYAARPIVLRTVTDALAARRAGFPAISVTCRDESGAAPNAHLASDTPDHIDPPALERAFGFCSELIELIDERLGPQVADLRERERVGEER